MAIICSIVAVIEWKEAGILHSEFDHILVSYFSVTKIQNKIFRHYICDLVLILHVFVTFFRH